MSCGESLARCNCRGDRRRTIDLSRDACGDLQSYVERALQVAFTAPGISKLGVPKVLLQEGLNGFPREFRLGMAGEGIPRDAHDASATSERTRHPTGYGWSPNTNARCPRHALRRGRQTCSIPANGAGGPHLRLRGIAGSRYRQCCRRWQVTTGAFWIRRWHKPAGDRLERAARARNPCGPRLRQSDFAWRVFARIPKRVWPLHRAALARSCI